jgi:hypothetical protein
MFNFRRGHTAQLLAPRLAGRGAGRVMDERGKNAVDLYATHRAMGTRYAISIKNQAEWVFPGSPAIKDLFVTARAHGREPWLIAPFMTDAARRRCEKNTAGRSRSRRSGRR